MSGQPDGTALDTQAGADHVAGSHSRRSRRAVAAEPPGPGDRQGPGEPDLDERERRQSARRRASGPEREGAALGIAAEDLGEAPELPSPPPTDPA